ncbi:MAG TPA: Lrp/AsnC family transcriptional regulator [Xanthomonadales bacterium]|nr:Lrp/AsnC family transcriptional regulator [Xanthomonadales bacterium]
MDRTDFEIVRQLRRNARISNKELAKSVGLAASTCIVRVRRLQNEGVIRGFHADLDASAIGIGLQALASVRLNRHKRVEVESFMEHILACPEVVQVHHLSGKNDFQVHIAVSNSHHLRDFVLQAFTERPEVDHVETSLVYETWDSWEVPINPELVNPD